MQIETLKIFCDLVETRSFSQAAERNLITQSAVSQQVRALEERFRRRLLERVRGRRDIRLTAAGEAFYEECRKVLAAYENLEERMRSLTETVSGVVRVATVYSIGLHELPPAVRRFMTLYPEAKIDLEYSRTTRIVRDVLSGAVDLGIVAYPEKRRGLEVVPLPGDRLVLICPPGHPLSKRRMVNAKDLDGEGFILFERDIPTRRATDRILRSYGVKVRRVIEFDNIETIKRAVEVGMGLAIVPRPSVLDEQKSGQLAVVALAEPEWTRSVGVIYRSDRALSTAARKFIDLLVEGSETK
ncbi:LysR family transcriptional regulator [Pyrinomonas methylaliphatogenes]|uniref:Transcriptional regulator n=1 Tax=Pyrinomonas methylaliphatogenes TaxID=454194 RepID=A0A0B6WY31_9BACT|nr:LysR family transcriptional regulator [Pyrinomonas methylaliphatogenes]MBX5479805.1 LysR family transcriptional regulator [Pyrinomonas methylaliphatogenes]CDM65070.1 transcriptional regulator [Pyrinomonas methylaliphatogenes]